MAPVRQVHRQDPVAGLQDTKINHHVSLTAAMRLNIDVFGSEKLFGSINGELLNHIHIFAATIPAPPGVTFRIFIRQNRSLSFHYRSAGKILGSDQFDILKLTDSFCFDSLEDFPIDFF